MRVGIDHRVVGVECLVPCRWYIDCTLMLIDYRLSTERYELLDSVGHLHCHLFIVTGSRHESQGILLH
jgi:hypothetical protein